MEETRATQSPLAPELVKLFHASTPSLPKTCPQCQQRECMHPLNVQSPPLLQQMGRELLAGSGACQDLEGSYLCF